MKKKNTILYIIFGIVIIVSAFLFFNNQKGTIKKELRDFAYEDTASINKIFLADKNNHTILLERLNTNTWRVNKKYLARRDAINLLLDGIASVKVKSTVPKPSLSNVTKFLATQSIKAEIYVNDEKVKTYYVGPPTPDNLGTYMILENSSVPFITYKQGFNGYLTIRYFTNEIDWRDVRLFPISINSFYSLNVFYPSNSDQSYTIIRKSPRDYKLLNNKGQEIPVFDTILTKEVAIFSTKVCVDTWDVRMPKNRFDSLQKTIPYAQINLKTVNGETYKLNLYRKQTENSTPQKPEYEPNVVYGIYNETTPALCQFFALDLVLSPLDFFTGKHKKMVEK